VHKYKLLHEAPTQTWTPNQTRWHHLTFGEKKNN